MRLRRKLNILLLLFLGVFAGLQLYSLHQKQWPNKNDRKWFPDIIGISGGISSDSRQKAAGLVQSRSAGDAGYILYTHLTNPSQINNIYNCDYPASVTTDKEALFNQMDGDWHWDWMQQRMTSLWSDWTNQTLELRKQWTNRTRSFKRILVLPGVLTQTSYAKPNVIRMGGALGDLVQWADLLAGLHILGHQVVIEYDIQRAAKNLLRLPAMTSCRNGGFDMLYVDILAAKALPPNVYNSYKCKLRVVDAYGTEAMYNDGFYANKNNYRSFYGRLGLNLKQFYTYYPHTPDNSFLGFVVSSKLQKSRYVKKENISLLYTKNPYFLKGHEDYIRAVQEVLPVHATLHKSDNLPADIFNHGIVSFSEYQKLAMRTKIFLGLGRPFESSGAMEAIARGSVFINPKFVTKRGKALQDLADYNGKPTTRLPTSQVSYLEEWVGPPHVYTIDITNITEVRQTLRQILTNTIHSYIPREFTMSGFLERLNAYVENQNFCDTKTSSTWPPLSELRSRVAPLGVSCQKHCTSLGMICEPVYFSHLNNAEAFRSQNITCHLVVKDADVYFPAIRATDAGACVLLSREILFSCALGHKAYKRLCPCRDYVKEQVALCKVCL